MNNIKEAQKKWREKNRSKAVNDTNKWREKNREQWLENHKKQSKKNREKKRLEILIHYGGNPPKCACCGESIFEFLTIDHIKNNGAEHRRQIGKSSLSLYDWIKKNNYPAEFQILCWNCNCARRNGICPHKKGELL